jgi:hypothetical protein
MGVLICSTILFLRLINKGGSSPSQSVLITPSLSHRQDIKALVGWKSKHPWVYKVQKHPNMQTRAQRNPTSTCNKQETRNMQPLETCCELRIRTPSSTRTECTKLLQHSLVSIGQHNSWYKNIPTKDFFFSCKSLESRLLKSNVKKWLWLYVIFLSLWRQTICHLFQSTFRYK